MQLPPSPTDLDHFKWHAALSNYSHESGQTEAEDNVVGAMVADVVVPRLQDLAKVAYDPYSTSATTKALNLVEEVTYCVDKNGRKFEVCLSLDLHDLANLAIRHTEFGPIFPRSHPVRSPTSGTTRHSSPQRDRVTFRSARSRCNSRSTPFRSPTDQIDSASPSMEKVR